MQEGIKKLEEEEFELLQRLNANRYKQRELKTNKYLQERGWEIGCDLKFVRQGKLLTVRLTGFEYNGTNVGHPVGLRHNVNGKPGNQRIIIWNDEAKQAIKI